MTNLSLVHRRLFGMMFPAIALAAVCAGDVRAQEAERAGGPLRWVGTSGATAIFVVGPRQPPNNPFPIWRWQFNKEMTGRFDTIAARLMVDCKANTQQTILLEAYGQGRFVRSVPANADGGSKITPKPGTVGAAVLLEACRPNVSASRRTAKDHREGRVLADQLLGKRGAPAVAAAPTAQPPAPVRAAAPSASQSPAALTPTYCKAVAAVMAASEDRSLKMGNLLLALGSENKATSADMEKARKLVAAAEAKRARAQQVLRQYSKAPNPDKALIARVRNTLISELEAQVAQCATGKPAATTAQLKGASPAPVAAAVPRSGGKAAAVQPAPPVLPKAGWTVDTRGAPNAADSFVEVSQVDPTGRFALVYGCSVKTKVRYARVYTSEAFDDTASYAPEVPLKLSVDGRAAEHFSFRFQKMPHHPRLRGAQGRSLETVDVTTRADAKGVARFLAAVRAAKSSIALSYFDKSMRFSADPTDAGFRKVDAQCAVL